GGGGIAPRCFVARFAVLDRRMRSRRGAANAGAVWPRRGSPPRGESEKCKVKAGGWGEDLQRPGGTRTSQLVCRNRKQILCGRNESAGARALPDNVPVRRQRSGASMLNVQRTD